jgi:hypothetical protein
VIIAVYQCLWPQKSHSTFINNSWNSQLDFASSAADDFDLGRTATGTVKNVPRPVRLVFCKCIGLIGEAMLDADEEVLMRADALAIIMPRLLLTLTSSNWWSSSVVEAVRKRCQRFVSRDWARL